MDRQEVKIPIPGHTYEILPHREGIDTFRGRCEVFRIGLRSDGKIYFNVEDGGYAYAVEDHDFIEVSK